MRANDGGSAFPGIDPNLGPVDLELTQVRGREVRCRGMSLRDYFAAAALTGLLSGRPAPCDQIAKEAYDYAEAMIAKRMKEMVRQSADQECSCKGWERGPSRLGAECEGYGHPWCPECVNWKPRNP